MGRLQSLKESIFGTPKKPVEVKSSAVIVLGSVKQGYGVRGKYTFEDQIKCYATDPVIKESIVHFAQEVAGPGYFTSMNEDYTLQLDGKTAKDVINEWCYANDLDNKLLQIVIELHAFGNSFWYITDGFQNIPLESIRKALPISKSIPVQEKYNLELTGVYKSKIIKNDEFVHFRTDVTYNAPLGIGIIHGLLINPDEDSSEPSFWELYKNERKYMDLGFKKFSFANELWTFDKVDDTSPEAFDELAKKITNMEDTGQRIVTNVKGDIKIAIPTRTTSYDQWLKQRNHALLMALANPTLKLGLEQGFTKATAEAAKEMFEMKITSIQRVIKRVFENLWVKVLEKEGFDGEKAQVRMNFGSEEIEYSTADVFSAVDKGIVTKDEARKILKESMKWKLEGELPVEPTVEPEKPVEPSLESKKESLANAILNEKKNRVMDAIIKGYEIDVK